MKWFCDGKRCTGMRYVGKWTYFGRAWRDRLWAVCLFQNTIQCRKTKNWNAPVTVFSLKPVVRNDFCRVWRKEYSCCLFKRNQIKMMSSKSIILTGNACTDFILQLQVSQKSVQKMDFCRDVSKYESRVLLFFFFFFGDTAALKDSNSSSCSQYRMLVWVGVFVMFCDIAALKCSNVFSSSAYAECHIWWVHKMVLLWSQSCQWNVCLVEKWIYLKWCRRCRESAVGSVHN